jgi:hypothetical protein
MSENRDRDSAARLCSLSCLERLERARNFPHNTCAASRHAQMIGEEMLRKEGEKTEAESILATVAALYEARTALADRQWVSIAERMPDPYVDVIGIAPGWNPSEMWVDAESPPSWRTGDEVVEGVTHWMPMPMRPSGYSL